MRDVPIIFSAPMVRALLEGRKTMTRRIIEPQPENAIGSDDKPLPITVYEGQGERPRIAIGRCITTQEVKYAVGDRLWVKESHWRWGRWKLEPTIPKTSWRFVPDNERLDSVSFDEKAPGYAPPQRAHNVLGWWRRPSIFHPRKFSRLTPIVTATKIERLQDITETDARAEGATARHYTTNRGQRCFGWSMDWPVADADCEKHDLRSARHAFGNFLCRLHNGPRWNLKRTNIWEENPQVVALTFTVHKQNIDTLPKAEAALSYA
jgi:hypothetical protein